MMREIEVPFEELPLHAELGFDAALINGVATIGFDDSGEWSVRSIALDAFRERSPEERQKAFERSTGLIADIYERKPVDLCRDSYRWMYDTIVDRLESECRFRNRIVDQVAKELADDGVALRNPNAEHSTLNRAQQGI